MRDVIGLRSIFLGIIVLKRFFFGRSIAESTNSSFAHCLSSSTPREDTTGPLYICPEIEHRVRTIPGRQTLHHFPNTSLQKLNKDTVRNAVLCEVNDNLC